MRHITEIAWLAATSGKRICLTWRAADQDQSVATSLADFQDSPFEYLGGLRVAESEIECFPYGLRPLDRIEFWPIWFVGLPMQEIYILLR